MACLHLYFSEHILKELFVLTQLPHHAEDERELFCSDYVGLGGRDDIRENDAHGAEDAGQFACGFELMDFVVGLFELFENGVDDGVVGFDEDFFFEGGVLFGDFLGGLGVGH